jgi:hypothetical protein
MQSTLLTDYIGKGTLASRPSNPNVQTGMSGYYYATDVKIMYAWNGSSWDAMKVPLFNPPLAASLTPYATVGSSATLTDDTSGGLSYSLALGAADSVRGAYRTLTTPSGDWTLVARTISAQKPTNWSSVGLYMHDTGSGKCVLWVKQAGTSNYRWNRQYWSAPATFTSESGTEIRGDGDWLRITKVSTTVTFDYSCDGHLWNNYLTESVTAFLTSAPTRVGIHGSGSNSTTLVISVPYLSLTGTAV